MLSSTLQKILVKNNHRLTSKNSNPPPHTENQLKIRSKNIYNYRYTAKKSSIHAELVFSDCSIHTLIIFNTCFFEYFRLALHSKIQSVTRQNPKCYTAKPKALHGKTQTTASLIKPEFMIK